MSTPFKAVEFAKHDTITREVLDTIQNNNQWLKENTPRGRFYAENNPAVNELVVVICGRVNISRNKKSATAMKRVRFGNAFSPTCRPNVTTGVVSESAKQIFCVVNGPNGKLLPQSTGFEIKIHAEDSMGLVGKKQKKWKISKGFYVNWQAVGFRREGRHDV